MTYRIIENSTSIRPVRVVMTDEPVKIRLCRRCLSAHTTPFTCKRAA